ncbi:MAG: hypothetical protein WBW36_20610, partial [Candidatus Sulfotelmatobacter sp.]
MFSHFLLTKRPSSGPALKGIFLAVVLSVLMMFAGTLAAAQDQSQAPSSSQTDNGKPKQDAPADAGGPSGDMGPYSIPKRTPEEAPPPPPPPTPKKVEGMPDYSI